VTGFEVATATRSENTNAKGSAGSVARNCRRGQSEVSGEIIGIAIASPTMATRGCSSCLGACPPGGALRGCRTPLTWPLCAHRVSGAWFSGAGGAQLL